MANDPQTYALGYEGPEVQEILEKSEDLGPATQSKDGLMSAADKEKLDGVSTGAQANVIEQIEVGGVILIPAEKKVVIPVDAAAAQGGANPVSSGALYAALLNYYTSAEVDQLIAGIKQFTYEVVAELPTASADTMYCIYFVPSTNPGTQNVKDEYITVRSGEEGSYTYSWEHIGTTAVDISGKADKVSGAVAGNLAGLDASGNLVDSGVPAEKIGEIEEEVSVLRNSAGIAEGIADTISAGTPQEFVFRQSGGDGVNYIKRIKGKSLAWNQLVQNGNFASIQYWGYGNGTFSVSNNIGQYTYSGSDLGFVYYQGALKYIPGHKYLLVGYINSDVSTNLGIGAGASYASGITAIEQKASSANMLSKASLLFLVESGSNASTFFVRKNGDFSISNINLFDLTLIFGAGNEPSTVAEFEALFPGYHDFGSKLISNDAEALESVGRNVWDEECGYNKKWNDNTGELESSLDRLYNLNPIPVVARAEYYAKTGSGYIYPHFYDGAMNYIGRSTTSEVRNNTFTVPTGACYMNFHTYNYNGPYNHDICINISDSNFNGQYEPYWKRTLNLGLKAIKVTDGTNIITVDGLKSAGSVCDEIDFARKKYVKRVGSVDLGDLSWEYVELYGIMASSTVTGIMPMSINIVSTRYPASSVAGAASAEDKSIYTRGDYAIGVKDSAYTSASAFKAAMDGVIAYYELATPIEYDLVDDIPNSILVDNLGTERAIFPEHEDGSPSAPFCCDSNYSISVKNLVAFINAQNNG